MRESRKSRVKESVLAAAEKQVADRVKELSDLQARLQTMEDARKKREEADWQGLVRTYEAMRPRDAAAIMNGMETPVLLEVFDRMNDRKAALVLAAMRRPTAPARSRQNSRRCGSRRVSRRKLTSRGKMAVAIGKSMIVPIVIPLAADDLGASVSRPTAAMAQTEMDPLLASVG